MSKIAEGTIREYLVATGRCKTTPSQHLIYEFHCLVCLQQTAWKRHIDPTKSCGCLRDALSAECGRLRKQRLTYKLGTEEYKRQYEITRQEYQGFRNNLLSTLDRYLDELKQVTPATLENILETARKIYPIFVVDDPVTLVSEPQPKEEPPPKAKRKYTRRAPLQSEKKSPKSPSAVADLPPLAETCPEASEPLRTTDVDEPTASSS